MWYIHHVPVHCVPVHVTPRPNEVTHSKCWGVLTHSPTPIKNTSILRQNLLHVKHPSKPRHYWPEPIFHIRHLSLKYKYKDHARELNKKQPPFRTPRTSAHERLTPTFSTHPITRTWDKNKTSSYRWMAPLRETIHPA